MSDMAAFEDEFLKLTEEINRLKNETCSKEESKIEKTLIDGTNILYTSGFFGNSNNSCATRRKFWTPPRSPYNLVQEVLYHDEWQLLLATMFLNKTTWIQTTFLARHVIFVAWKREAITDGNLVPFMARCINLGQKAIPQLWVFLSKWNSPEAVCHVDIEEIKEVLKPLGLHEKRAQLIKSMSDAYLKGKWKNPKDLPGIGKYGDDSYKIFCEGRWKNVNPTDKKLRKYIQFLSSKYSGLKARRSEAQ